MSPLQLSVFWRLSLAFFFNAFLFFIDIFIATLDGENCQHGNGTSDSGTNPQNQSVRMELLEEEFDWMTKIGSRDCVARLHGCPTAESSSWWVCCLDRWWAEHCLTGVCCCCINNCSVSLAVEWTAPSARLWSPVFLGFCFSLGTMAGALLAWLSPTWTQLHLSLALPHFMCLPLFRSLPESPRWLVLMGRTDVLYRYCRGSAANKQCVDMILGADLLEKQRAAQTAQSPSDLLPFKHPTVLLRLSIMGYLGAATALTYYGICMNIGSFGVNIYSAQFFSGLSEAPCLLIPLVRLDRRPFSMLTLCLSGSACLVSLLLSRYQCDAMLVMGLALLGKFSILATTYIWSLYNIELFPTVVRQRCMAVVDLCYRLGCLFSTLFPPNPEGAIPLVAMLIYSSGPIIGCGLCLLLPETSGTPLPDSLDDCLRPTQHSHEPRIHSLRSSCPFLIRGKVTGKKLEQLEKKLPTQMAVVGATE
ncbi:si:dkey-190l8.2 isoform X4 [Syngnathus scovelli]|uniref:si:dkey-190l8.2 isoform X4 n=1 Tax=Syngnathus scovelli TaxID=161590 RepID=UPI00210F9CD1|nr:solute carrier family 22 member 13 isoform X4 [Syngnathus scovelli]